MKPPPFPFLGRGDGKSKERVNAMGKIPDELREIIAWNIRDCRMKKHPGRGGSKKCAEEFKVSPQQWSPWENGKRTPDEIRLGQIAKFFGKSVEYMRRDNRPGRRTESVPEAQEPPPGANGAPQEEQTAPTPGSPPIAPPGTSESFFWLARYMADLLATGGVKVQVEIVNNAPYPYGQQYPR